jgi:hypothetical protein
MHITLINYTKTFNLGSYQSEKIGVEININEGEDAKEALSTAKALVHEFYMEGLPVHPEIFSVVADNTPVPIQQIEEKPEIKLSKKEKQIAEIASCTKLEKPDGLLSYEVLLKTYPYLTDIYNETLKRLTDGAK